MSSTHWSVGLLGVLALASLVAWIMAPNIWFLTLAIICGAVAADRGIAFAPISDSWRFVTGLPAGAAVFMIWLADGRLLALLLWLIALGVLRLGVRGLFQQNT